jgi:hypothetical protein
MAFNVGRLAPGVTPAQVHIRCSGIIARFRQDMPEVSAIGFGRSLPLYRVGGHRTGVLPEGIEQPSDRRVPPVEFNYIDSEDLATLGIPIRQGRGFRPATVLRVA